MRPNSAITERRRLDRRVTPVEALEDPPVLERRRSPDRRVSANPSRGRPGELLPDRWRDGWLVYEEVPAAPRAARETRRLAPIPPRWESWSEAELAEQLAHASLSRRPTN